MGSEGGGGRREGEEEGGRGAAPPWCTWVPKCSVLLLRCGSAVSVFLCVGRPLGCGAPMVYLGGKVWEGRAGGREKGGEEEGGRGAAPPWCTWVPKRGVLLSRCGSVVSVFLCVGRPPGRGAAMVHFGCQSVVCCFQVVGLQSLCFHVWGAPFIGIVEPGAGSDAPLCAPFIGTQWTQEPRRPWVHSP